MKLFSSLILLAFVMFIFPACKGQKQLADKNGKHAQLLHATSQRILPGVAGAEIETNYNFDILWHSDQPPVTFFWKNRDEWMNCAVYKMAAEVRAKEIAPETTKKGDSLRLVPIAGGRHVMPAEIDKNLERGIFYRTASSGWMHLEVKTITKKPDIAMP